MLGSLACGWKTWWLTDGALTSAGSGAEDVLGNTACGCWLVEGGCPSVLASSMSYLYVRHAIYLTRCLQVEMRYAQHRLRDRTSAPASLHLDEFQYHALARDSH